MTRHLRRIPTKSATDAMLKKIVSAPGKSGEFVDIIFLYLRSKRNWTERQQWLHKIIADLGYEDHRELSKSEEASQKFLRHVYELFSTRSRDTFAKLAKKIGITISENEYEEAPVQRRRSSVRNIAKQEFADIPSLDGQNFIITGLMAYPNVVKPAIAADSMITPTIRNLKIGQEENIGHESFFIDEHKRCWLFLDGQYGHYIGGDDLTRSGIKVRRLRSGAFEVIITNKMKWPASPIPANIATKLVPVKTVRIRTI